MSSICLPQTTQELYFTDFLANSLDQTTSFLANNLFPFTESLSESEKNKLHFTVRFILILAARANSSYVIKNKKEIIGVIVNIDAIDYMNILEKLNSQIMMKKILDISGFQKTISQFVSERGQYLLSLMAVAKQQLSSQTLRKEFNYLYQGIILCKVSGWKSIVFATSNPVPFLKINGIVLEDKGNKFDNKQYLMQLKLDQLTLQKNVFNKGINPKL